MINLEIYKGGIEFKRVGKTDRLFFFFDLPIIPSICAWFDKNDKPYLVEILFLIFRLEIGTRKLDE